VLKDFQGLVSDCDASDIPNGAMAEQMNMFSLQIGSLQPRGGLTEVTLTRLE
jgi:hypothetical protein